MFNVDVIKLIPSYNLLPCMYRGESWVIDCLWWLMYDGVKSVGLESFEYIHCTVDIYIRVLLFEYFYCQ